MQTQLKLDAVNQSVVVEQSWCLYTPSAKLTRPSVFEADVGEPVKARGALDAAFCGARRGRSRVERYP